MQIIALPLRVGVPVSVRLPEFEPMDGHWNSTGLKGRSTDDNPNDTDDLIRLFRTTIPLKESSNMYTLQERPIDTSTLEAVHIFLLRISASYPVSRAIIFGSRARGKFQSDSDADVAIVLAGNIGNFSITKVAMADIAYDVLLETGIRVQPLPIWEEQWANPDTYSNPQLLHNINREGVIL